MKKRIALIIAFVLAMSTLSVVASAIYDPNYPYIRSGHVTKNNVALRHEPERIRGRKLEAW